MITALTVIGEIEQRESEWGRAQRRERRVTIPKATGNLSKAGWSWGCVSADDSLGRTIFVADAHRDDGQRFIVRANEKLSALVELESAVRAAASCLD